MKFIFSLRKLQACQKVTYRKCFKSGSYVRFHITDLIKNKVVK